MFELVVANAAHEEEDDDESFEEEEKLVDTTAKKHKWMLGFVFVSKDTIYGTCGI